MKKCKIIEKVVAAMSPRKIAQLNLGSGTHSIIDLLVEVDNINFDAIEGLRKSLRAEFGEVVGIIALHSIDEAIQYLRLTNYEIIYQLNGE